MEVFKGTKIVNGIAIGKIKLYKPAVYEINGPMFFATSDKYSAIPLQDGVKVLILRMRNVPSLDVSAMRSLT